MRLTLREDLSQTILGVQILVAHLTALAVALVALQGLHQVVEVLDDARLFGVVTFAPQVHIEVLLVVERALEDVAIGQGHQFGARYATLHTQRVGDTRGHNDDLFEVLDQLAPLPINAVQDAQPILQHLTVLEEAHLGEHHLDGQLGRQLDEDVALPNEGTILGDPIIHVVEL